MFVYCHNNPLNEVDVSGNFGLFALGTIGAIAGGVINYAGQVLSNYKQGKSGTDAWTNVNWGSVASSAFSGAISAIPGAGALGEAVDVVGSNLIEHGVNALVSGESMNLEDIKNDILSDALTSVFLPDIIPSKKVPRFIRDIKDDARALGIKGTRKLERYLGFSQITTIVTNAFNADTSSRILDYARG